MTTPAQALEDLATYTMSRPLPLDALVRLAAPVGYEARGERVQAEHHLGMALGIFSRGGESPLVSITEVEGLLRLIAALAQGAPRPAATTRSIDVRRCAGRVVGPHGVIERCTRPAQDGETMCARCASRHPHI